MKKKIFSLVLSICLLFGGIFSFSGCSLVSKDSDKINSNIVMKVGDDEITKTQLINAFYTYYQNNSNYFAYYDESTIEESFYTWFIVKTLVNQLSGEALDNGDIIYTTDDADEVWKNVENYFYSQVSSYEKSIYKQNGVAEENYPKWLQDDEDEEETSSFEEYVSPIDEIDFSKSAETEKLTESEVYAKVDDLIVGLFKYVKSVDDEGNEEKETIPNPSESFSIRNQAYANYVGALLTNSEASGSTTDKKEVLKKEVLRIYEAYYESQISVIFQNYFIQDQLLNYQGKGDSETLSNSTVVGAFLNQYRKEMQANQVQEDYIEIMESSDGASVVLYHYEGSDYYFSVQHILVKFTENLSNQVKNLYGYSTSDADEAIAEAYQTARNTLASTYSKAMLAEVNEDAEKDSILTIADYYYYDEDLADRYYGVDGETRPVYNGYVKLSTHTYSDGEVNYVYTPYVNADSETITYQSNGVVRMANVDDIIEAYTRNYELWVDAADDIFNGTKTVEEVIAEDEDKYEPMKYVLDTAKNLRDCGETDINVLKNKISSYVFVELEWVYSSDSLDNKISNKIGYIISNRPDNNMSWMVEFAVGAREMISNSQSMTEEEKITYTEKVVTDYGYHIMKLENIYDSEHSTLVDLSTITDEYSLSNDSDYVKNIAKLLKKTYLCSASNETLYDYYRDEAYNNLVGTSSSSGTYFVAIEYQWINKYYNDNKIEIIKKMSYEELVDSLS